MTFCIRCRFPLWVKSTHFCRRRKVGASAPPTPVCDLHPDQACKEGLS